PTVHWCDTTSSRGDIRCGGARAKALLNTYVDGTNTRVREGSPVQSFTPHSPALSTFPRPSLRTAIACAKQQSDSQERRTPT
ncbi:hypothetical protein KUCAC02_000774, partial [Chaenocephalus aceratus]